MKKIAITILLVPFALAGGFFYGWIADKIFRDREPWFTLSMLSGLALSVCFTTWLGGGSRTAAIWVFVGTGLCYVALRLLFGRGSALEMFYTPHLCAILLLLLLPSLVRAKEKARRLHEMRSSQALQRADTGRIVISSEARLKVDPQSGRSLEAECYEIIGQIDAST